MKKTKYAFGITLILCLLLASCQQNSSESVSQDSNASDDISTSLSVSPSTSSSTSTSTPTSVPSTLPTPKNATIASLNAKKVSDAKNLYRITGVVQQVVNDSYGNFDITDSTGSILCWGLDSTPNCFSYNSSTLTYSSLRTFGATSVKPGDTITMVGWYLYYGGYQSEIQGYLESRTDGGVQPFVGADYTTAESYSGTYYNSIGTQTGTALATSLHNLMMSTHGTYVLYDSLDSTLKTADGNGSKINCFYSGTSSSSFNKEHVWPQGKSNKLYGTSYAGSDIHHIRATLSTYNSARGSNFIGLAYGNATTIANSRGGSCKYSTYGGTYGTFEPASSIKGDVARIIMYVYIHYSSEVGGTQTSGITGSLSFTNVLGPRSTSQCVKMLREWNASDPVSQEEKTRNETAYSRQGNRNPFIDHPTYADKIWSAIQ